MTTPPDPGYVELTVEPTPGGLHEHPPSTVRVRAVLVDEHGHRGEPVFGNADPLAGTFRWEPLTLDDPNPGPDSADLAAALRTWAPPGLRLVDPQQSDDAGRCRWVTDDAYQRLVEQVPPCT